MYCSGCGQLLDIDAQVCRRCGKPVAGIPAVAPLSTAYASPGGFRVQRHVQALGVLWIVYAIFNTLQMLFAATLLTGMFGGLGNRWGMNPGLFWERFPFYNVAWLIPFITVLTVGRAILSTVTGLALLRRAPWGRTLALVTAFLTILKPVTGTILAIYTLWALISARSAHEYASISVPQV